MLHLHFLIISAIPKVVIDPPRPGKVPPNHHNHIPDLDQQRTTTTRPPVTPKIIFPKLPPTATTTTKAPRPRVTPSQHRPLVPTRKPFIPTQKPFIPTRKPPVPTRKPYIPRPAVPTRPPLPLPPVTPVDNTIQKEVTKQRGDVHSKRLLALLRCCFVSTGDLKPVWQLPPLFRYILITQSFWVISIDIIFS